MPDTETILTYTEDGKTYEIDHLGINYPEQWGQFAVYYGRWHVAAFAIAEDGQPIPAEFAALRGSPPAVPAELPVTDEELIRLAKQAVKEATDA